IPLLDDDAFIRFLTQQTHIEELDIGLWEREKYRAKGRPALKPDALPHLRRLRCFDGFVESLRIIKGRPVSSVELGFSKGLSPEELPEFAHLLRQGSAPLICLALGIRSKAGDIDSILGELLSMISFSQHSLCSLTIKLRRVDQPQHPWKEEPGVPVDTNALILNVQKFSVLENFRLHSGGCHPPDTIFKASAPLVPMWRRFCPSL
ncbi:hypothetical protein FRC08_006026, partial [Ceratobasidium sp. 394]